MGSSRSWLGLVGSIVATLSLACVGCGDSGPVGEGGDGEHVASVAEAITSTDYMDGTKTILMRVKTCDYVSSQASGSLHDACALCIMDSGWARVGGGAEISGEAAPGAQLMASRPDWTSGSGPLNCGGGGVIPPNEPVDIWIARSRGGVAHQLRAYVVGMKIKNGVGAWVAPEVHSLRDSVTGFAGSPAIASTTSLVDPGSITVGGGAEVVPPATTGYLIESAPLNAPEGLVWRARARYVSGEPLGGVKTWVVSLKQCPSAWNGDCFSSRISIREAIASATSGYGTASYTLPSSWLTPVVGGKSPSGGGGGRYLADLIPWNGSNRGALVRSKPGPVADSGGTHALALALGRDQAPYMFNSVRFNSGGYTLYRPSGVNPKLQQSPTPGDTAAARWHLEHLGSGVYRIRNGNPDSGSECAYRVSGTTTVRVTTCGTGNEFKWTSYSGATIYTGPFQLKNATSSTLCLDNNGLAGAGPSDLLLKTCSAFSNAQLLFLDTYNWPPP